MSEWNVLLLIGVLVFIEEKARNVVRRIHQRLDDIESRLPAKRQPGWSGSIDAEANAWIDGKLPRP